MEYENKDRNKNNAPQFTNQSDVKKQTKIMNMEFNQTDNKLSGRQMWWGRFIMFILCVDGIVLLGLIASLVYELINDDYKYLKIIVITVVLTNVLTIWCLYTMFRVGIVRRKQ